MIIKDKLKAICVIYVAITMISTVLALLQGTHTDADLHLIARLVVIIIAIAPLSIFEKLKNKKPIIRTVCHYIVTMSLVFAFVWSMGLFVTLHPDAYRDIFLNYTGAYIAFCLVYLLYNRGGKSVIAKLKRAK